MSARFIIRKNNGDPQYPWTFLDALCRGSESHDFSAENKEMPEDCDGNCDAFMSFEAAIDALWLVPA